jgi:hypothetical protein
MSSAPPDPRLTYAGPYRNVHPDVPYVGDAECAPCHADICDSYRRHPMSNSLLPIAQVAGQQRYGPEQHNPFRDLQTLFRVERHGDRVWHRQKRLGPGGKVIYELDTEVHYAIGSGNHGRSYLTDHDGYLFQTAISWYGQKQIWAVSPGFGESLLAGRVVRGACLFCHANPFRADPDKVNHFLTPTFPFGHAIGCERCHGPGGRHVETSDRLDVVNPRRLDWKLREAVCEQCHLEAEVRVVRRGRGLLDFRPGLPLEAFWGMFVHAGGEEYKAVSHVEQMYQSTCFRRSTDGDKLGCVSCHDPHVKVRPDRRVGHYRQRCQHCHESQPCSLPREARLRQSKGDSCIDCHMPRYSASDIVHTASTDHRILRQAGVGRRAGRQPPADASRAPEVEVPVTSFYRDRLPADADAERDLGMALARMIWEGRSPGGAVGRAVVPLLESALRNDPGDVDALEAKAVVLSVLKRPAEALAAAEAGLEKAPRREVLLAAAATAAQELADMEKALAYGRQAVAANPWNPQYRRRLARLLASRGDWEESSQEAQAWLRLEPGSVEARMTWVTALLRLHRPEEARAAFATVERLQPPNLEELRAWVRRQAR